MNKKMINTQQMKLQSDRSPYWDNLKGILIALVVFAHCLYAFKNRDILNYTVTGIYLFHMPAFVFVSGYFSKSLNSRSPRSVAKLLAAYLLLTLVHMIMAFYMGKTLKIVTPYYSSWYLLALIVWRLTAQFTLRSKWAVPVMVVFSLLAGLWGDIDNRFAIARIISFYPFFALGFFLSKDDVSRITRLSPVKRLFGGLACVISAVLLSYYSISKLKLGKNDYLFDPYKDVISISMFKRILIFMIASLCILALLLFITEHKVPIITKAGRNSLSIFLIHRPITLILNSFVKDFSSYGLLLYAVLFTLLSLTVLGSETISKALNLLLNYTASGFVPNDNETAKSILHSRILVIIVLLMILILPALRLIM